jgi:hypothetical protein
MLHPLEINKLKDALETAVKKRQYSKARDIAQLIELAQRNPFEHKGEHTPPERPYIPQSSRARADFF